MDVKVLGNFSAVENGRQVTPSAAKPRTLLALLTLYSDQVLPVSVLIEELWGENPPRSAATTLQTYILQIRRLIKNALPTDADCDCKMVLRTEQNGYVLDRRGGYLDAAEYSRCLVYATQAMQNNDYQMASRRFSECLKLWRGPALVDVKTGPRLEVEATRLEESRLGALDRRIECDLMLGAHHEILGELAALTAQYPMHEGLHRQLMLALYRAGRRSHALDAFRRLRGVLNDELGLEPSPRLQALQRAVLEADPVLELFEAARPTLGLLRAG
ncbi:AfsR/SARP family transcriptional regulator [Catellatospora tritici]|uniref:AfsR/SARP family transcriptional regulator n=1 Tax=Catellatospora tritici TaxID=2851566 RepID=UPI001C2D5CFF|nr:AfsR/SARP family transcriptional regulator [Catellatospora tritici]MBV1855608.1 AfsR/SARP family transcriptional regulator [Catellatospora tritici]